MWRSNKDGVEENHFIIKEEIFTSEETVLFIKREEDIKMNKVPIKEEISPVEEMCTFYINEDDIKIENTEIQRNLVFIVLTNIM